jgi:hypothetical protein
MSAYLPTPISHVLADVIGDAERQLARKDGTVHEVRLTRGQWNVVRDALKRAVPCQ